MDEPREPEPVTPHARHEAAQNARMWRIVADTRWHDVVYWRERHEHGRVRAAEASWRDADQRATAAEQRLGLLGGADHEP